MSAGKHKGRSTARTAWEEGTSHLAGILGVTAVTLLLRIAVLLPLVLAWQYPETFDALLPAWAWSVWVGGVCVFGVIPMRCWAGEHFRYFSGGHYFNKKKGAYFVWLRTGLVRWLRGILWGLPFLVCAGYFIYGFKNLPFNKMWQPIQQLAGLIGQEPSIQTGIMIFFGATILFAILFAYGWWRDMPVEYLHVRFLKTKRSFQKSRQVRKKGKRRIIRNRETNCVLSLPAWIGCLAVLVPYIQSNVFYSSNPQIMFTSLIRLLRKPLPLEQVFWLMLVYLVLYLPLCIFRKLRNAVVVRRISRRLSEEEGDHAAG